MEGSEAKHDLDTILAASRPTSGVGKTGRRTLTCCLCRRSQHGSAFSVYFRHPAVDATQRRCLSCTELGVKNAYKQTRHMFKHVDARCSIFEAARLGNVYRVLNDLDSGAASVNAFDKETGRTLLHEVVATGHILLCECLLTLGAKVDARSLVSRETPLFSAVSNNQPTTVLLLLANGCSTSVRDKRYATALHYVESAEVASLLLRVADMDIDAVNGAGLTVTQAVRNRVGGGSAESPKLRGRSRSVIMARAAHVAHRSLSEKEEEANRKELLAAIEEELAQARMQRAIATEARLARKVHIDREARLAAERRRQEQFELKQATARKAKLEKWTTEYRAWRRGDSIAKELTAEEAKAASIAALEKVAGRTL